MPTRLIAILALLWQPILMLQWCACAPTSSLRSSERVVIIAVDECCASTVANKSDDARLCCQDQPERNDSCCEGDVSAATASASEHYGEGCTACPDSGQSLPIQTPMPSGGTTLTTLLPEVPTLVPMPERDWSPLGRPVQRTILQSGHARVQAWLCVWTT